ncbi:MAG: FliM/FliN family flagellar motor switch protein [Deltaproteobacteria bacterium]|nr:FliM/FliN family flagellar motor switch protein [Deltaproteobacteria bacterium]
MTESVKSNVEIPLIVELSRLPMTLEKIGELTQGQVIELAQKPGDPVELIVSDKSIGQGELVEVEGKLGVKVLSLLGS